MSSTTGLNRQMSGISSADMVQQQITSVDNQLTSLNQDLESLGNEVHNLVAELQVLQPPSAPGAGANAAAVQAFQTSMSAYHSKVNAIRGQIEQLNQKSQQIANKISDLNAKVGRLEASDLPDAQRKDTERQEDELRSTRNEYESVAKSIEKSSAQLDADQAAKRDGNRVQMRIGGAVSDTSTTMDQAFTLRVKWSNNEVKLDQSSDLKTIVRAFSVMMAPVGDGSDFARRANPAIGMPLAQGGPLPPIDMP